MDENLVCAAGAVWHVCASGGGFMDERRQVTQPCRIGVARRGVAEVEDVARTPDRLLEQGRRAALSVSICASRRA